MIGASTLARQRTVLEAVPALPGDHQDERLHLATSEDQATAMERQAAALLRLAEASRALAVARTPDVERWRQVVAVILDRWPTPTSRAQLAGEVAAEARELLAGPLNPDALRRAGALVLLALDALEAPTATEERSQP